MKTTRDKTLIALLRSMLFSQNTFWDECRRRGLAPDRSKEYVAQLVNGDRIEVKPCSESEG